MDMTNKGFQESLKELCKQYGVTKQEYKIIKEYNYVDEKGLLVSQTIRFDPKKFSQRTKKNGQWVWNLKGVNTVFFPFHTK